MTKKERRVRLLIAGGLVAAFVCFVGWVIWSLYMAENGNHKPEAIPYEEIAFTSKDISSLEFALNGQVLTFPTTVKELEDAGYTLDVPYQNEVLQGSNGTVYCAVNCSARNGEGSMIRFSACNLSKESKPIEECEIENISAEDALFILCNGVSLESSYEEVIAIMGEPDEYEEEGNAKKLTYMIADGYLIYIRYMNGNYEVMETLQLSDRTH